MSRPCSVTGCEQPHYCKCFCRKHYLRVKAHGHPAGGRTHAPPEVRFWRYVDKRGPDECWPWIGKRQKSGYGRIGIGATLQVGAHRLSHKIATGEEPEVVMHTCDNPWCVNPAHLRGGTMADNMADMRAKGRDNHTDRVRGSEHHRAKLTEDDVREIKRHPDIRPGKLAKKFGVKSAAIYRIRAGLAWKHVE